MKIPIRDLFNKKQVVGLVILVLVLVSLSIWLGLRLGKESFGERAGESEYVAVYLKTGDIYFGKLSWFPWPRLENVLYLQRETGEGGQIGFRILPFTSVFWQPSGRVYLNPKEIVFWTHLREDSQLLPYLKDPKLFERQLQQLQARPPASPQAEKPSSPPDFRGPKEGPPGQQ